MTEEERQALIRSLDRVIASIAEQQRRLTALTIAQMRLMLEQSKDSR